MSYTCTTVLARTQMKTLNHPCSKFALLSDQSCMFTFIPNYSARSEGCTLYHARIHVVRCLCKQTPLRS